MVRRTASKPISIIRSTSVPAQLQDRSQAGDPEAGGGSGGKTTSRRGLHFRDRSLQHDFNSGVVGGPHGIVQSLPPPQAPLLAGSLPPSRFLDDLPPLSLGPQVCGTCARRHATWYFVEKRGFREYPVFLQSLFVGVLCRTELSVLQQQFEHLLSA